MARTYSTRVGELEFTHAFGDGYPTDATVRAHRRQRLVPVLPACSPTKPFLDKTWTLPDIERAG